MKGKLFGKNLEIEGDFDPSDFTLVTTSCRVPEGNVIYSLKVRGRSTGWYNYCLVEVVGAEEGVGKGEVIYQLK